MLGPLAIQLLAKAAFVELVEVALAFRQEEAIAILVQD